VARGDGTATVYDAQPSKDKLVVVKEWNEPKFRPTCRYIGLDVRPQSVFSFNLPSWVESDHRMVYRGVFTCTSIGHFRLARLEESNDPATATLPLRLRDLKMSSSGENFAYGGDEVDLSVWNTERALSGPSVSTSPDTAQAGQKRKKSKPSLLYGEIWRARNVSTMLQNMHRSH
jgi:ribosome biogenesis protein NSA1